MMKRNAFENVIFALALVFHLVVGAWLINSNLTSKKEIRELNRVVLEYKLEPRPINSCVIENDDQ